MGRACVAFGLASGWSGCSKKPEADRVHVAASSAAVARQPANAGPVVDAGASEEPGVEQAYPLVGQVTVPMLVVRKQPSPQQPIVGWLYWEDEVRLKATDVKTKTCASGWYEVHPVGFLCKGEGLQLKTPATRSAAAEPPTMPYRYYFVKDVVAPEFHRTPTWKELDAVLALVRRYRELKAKKPEKAEELLLGTLPDEPPIPPYVKKFLQRGFYVAGREEHDLGSNRVFVETARGTFVWRTSLEERIASSFQGVELGEGQHTLPIAWTVRAARRLVKKTKYDGTVRFVDEPEAELVPRYTRVPWQGREYNGTKWVHKLQGERYLHPWFLGVAEAIKPPAAIAADEVWVHVDRGEQTLVMYRGAHPVYATLVSTGLPEHETPVGEFEVRAKHISDTMADIGADAANDRYRIDDVPWTQYFRGSLALHGTFWHDRFGLRRSHGCVNLSPTDAKRIFLQTAPRVPRGWHGLSARETGWKGSRVVVTD